MKEQKSLWWKSMLAKHGSEEAVRAFMRDSASKSSRNTKGTGYFGTLSKENPELFKKISGRGGEATRDARQSKDD